MKILVLASEYPYESDSNSDRTKVVGYFAREWVKQGHQVIAIVNSSTFPSIYYSIGNRLRWLTSKSFDISRTPNRLWTKRFSYSDFGVRVENIPITKFIPHGKFSKAVLDKQYNEILSILKKYEFVPDVVTGHWVNPQLMLVPKIAKFFDAKSTFVFHADYGEKNYKKFKVQKFMDQIDHIGFRSQSAINIAKNYMTFKNNPFVVYSGIPDKFVNEIKSDKKSFDKPISLITVGRLVEYKKIDAALIAIIDVFKKDNYDYVIVGDGPMKTKLEDYIVKHEQQNKIRLIEWMNRNNLQNLIYEKQVFVLISKHETFGLVYLEAMLQGCIVIASKYGGVDGIIKDGENGFLCEEGNVKHLSKILIRIKEMSILEKIKLSNNAQATARKFTESKVAEEYLERIIE